MIFIKLTSYQDSRDQKRTSTFPRSGGFHVLKVFWVEIVPPAMSRKLALKTGLQGDVITLSAVEGDAP